MGSSVALPPVPSDVGAMQGKPQPPTQGDMSSIVGPQESQAPKADDRQEKMKAFMQRMQKLDEQLKYEAREFPEFSQAAKQAGDAIGKGLAKVVATMSRGNEAPAPKIPY